MPIKNSLKIELSIFGSLASVCHSNAEDEPNDLYTWYSSIANLLPPLIKSSKSGSQQKQKAEKYCK